jgi:enoyl-[acyl-carrier-protein] reductase (NADH)
LNRELRGNRSKESSNTNNSRNGYSTEEAANVVKFLAWDDTSYVTGATFFVDSGTTLYPSFGTNEDHNVEKHGSSINANKKK